MISVNKYKVVAKKFYEAFSIHNKLMHINAYLIKDENACTNRR